MTNVWLIMNEFPLQMLFSQWLPSRESHGKRETQEVRECGIWTQTHVGVWMKLVHIISKGVTLLKCVALVEWSWPDWRKCVTEESRLWGFLCSVYCPVCQLTSCSLQDVGLSAIPPEPWLPAHCLLSCHEENGLNFWSCRKVPSIIRFPYNSCGHGVFKQKWNP